MAFFVAVQSWRRLSFLIREEAMSDVRVRLATGSRAF